MRTTTSRMFVADNETAQRPLDRALRWASAQSEAFVVLAHEDETTRRCYQALSGEELRRWAHETPAAERHAHEVIAWPTKLYGDVDLEQSSGADATFWRCVTALVRAAEQRFDVVCDQPVVLDSSSDTKFSRHFVVEMRRRSSRESVRFATGADCGRFVESIGEATGVCDRAVYRRNNCLRVYGSTKLSDPTRAFRPLGVGAQHIEWDLFERSLVAWPRMTDSRRMLVVRPNGDRMPTTTPTREKRTPSGAAIVAEPGAYEAIREVDAMCQASIVSIKRSQSSGFFLVNTRSRHCAQKGAEHRSNTIYFLVDLQRRRYQQRCHSPHCTGQRVEWTPFDDGPQPTLARVEVVAEPALKRPRTPTRTYPDDIRQSFLALSSSSVADSSESSRSL